MAATTSRTGAVRSHGFAMLGALAGLLPQLLAIAPFVFGMWGLGLTVSIAGNALVIGSHLYRRKPVGTLDVSSTILTLVLAVGYFGFGNVLVLRHFGAVIYGLLLGQVLFGERRGEPWTAQFSKRMFPPERWRTRAFFEGNRLLSRVWGSIFIVDILMAAFGTTPLVLFVLPNVLLVAAVLIGPSLGHWYGLKFAQSAISITRSRPVSTSE
jgi:hypothetical protein